ARTRWVLPPGRVTVAGLAGVDLGEPLAARAGPPGAPPRARGGGGGGGGGAWGASPWPGRGRPGPPAGCSRWSRVGARSRCWIPSGWAWGRRVRRHLLASAIDLLGDQAAVGRGWGGRLGPGGGWGFR